MGNFEDHLQYGLFSFVITLACIFGLAYVFVWPYQLALAFTPIAFGATVFGSLLPDIDHHNSRPYKTIRYVLPLASGAVTLAGVWFYFPVLNTGIQEFILLPQELIAFGGFVIACIVTVIVREVIAYLRPPHRGITHTLSFTFGCAVVTSSVAFILLQATDISQIGIQSASLLFGASLAVGILSHLYCDDMIL